MRETITIPAAGVTKVFSQFSGRSVIIEEMPVYTEAAQIPILDFQPGIVQYPLYPRSDYPNSTEFSALRITGTTESAGDEIALLTTSQCLDLSINILFSESYQAEAGNSFKKTMDGTVQQITEVELMDANGNLPQSVYIASGGTGEISYLWNDGGGLNPSEGGSDYVLVEGAEPIEILGIDFILKLRFINAVNGETPDLVITPRY